MLNIRLNFEGLWKEAKGDLPKLPFSFKNENDSIWLK